MAYPSDDIDRARELTDGFVSAVHGAGGLMAPAEIKALCSIALVALVRGKSLPFARSADPSAVIVPREVF